MNNNRELYLEMLQTILEESNNNVLAIWTDIHLKVIVQMKELNFTDLGDVISRIALSFNMDRNNIQGRPVKNNNRLNKEEGYYVDRH